MKRDSTNFKVFKDKKQFKHRHLFSTAASQDVKEVFDPHYTPLTPDDSDLFNEKHIYMYSISDTILKSERGIFLLDSMSMIMILSKFLLNLSTTTLIQ